MAGHADVATALTVRGGYDPRYGENAAPARVGDLVSWKLDYTTDYPAWFMDSLPPEGSDYLKLVLQLSGRTKVEKKGGRSSLLEPGTWGLYGLSRSCKVCQVEPAQQLVFILPRPLVNMSRGELSCVFGRQYGSEGAASASAFRFLGSLHDDVASARSPFSRELANVAVHLLNLALAEQLSGQRSCTKTMMRARIQAYIDMNLSDPLLSIEKIAQAMKCSSRYLHKLFSEEESMSRYIWRRRLNRCREALVDPRCVDKSITEICFSLGFSNASHFSRAFKEKFGVSPSEYRTRSIAA